MMTMEKKKKKIIITIKSRWEVNILFVTQAQRPRDALGTMFFVYCTRSEVTSRVEHDLVQGHIWMAF